MTRQNPVPRGHIVLAIVLFIGVLILAFGYYQQNRIGFYLGLFVIIAGVLNGIVHIILRSK